MARTGITYEQVAQVADTLTAAGEQPTIRSVRESIGSGSPNTIHKHLSTWRDARPQAVAAAPVLPETLATAISREIERAASAARAEIEGVLVQTQAEAAELAAIGEAIEIERDALAEQVAALTSERDQAQATATERAAEILRQAETITREQQAAEAARVDLATARLKLESQTEALIETKAEIKAARAALTEAQQGRTAAEKTSAVLTAKLEAAAEEIRKAEGRADTEAKRAAKEADTREATAKGVRAELDAARSAAAQAREEAAKAAGQAEAMRARIDALEKALAVASAAHADNYTPKGK